MTRLEIKLLGTFQATLDGDALTGFRSDKARALLAYLAVEKTRPHRREWLATLLWGDFDDRAARRSLSSVLANLRQLLSPLGAAITLDADRSHVWLQATPELITVDVSKLHELLDWTSRHAHRSPMRCAACIQRLAQAAELYVGSFLPGLTFSDSPIFDEWQRTQQETLHQQMLQALGVLAMHHLTAGRLALAEQYARRQIALQPWHEEAHRLVMVTLARSGQRNAALAQYEQCRAILEAELGVEPDPESGELYQRIRAGLPLPALAWAGDSVANPYRGLQSFRETDADNFHGRERITHQLIETVQRRPFVALIGPSGSGKSSLLHAGLIHRLRRMAPAAAGPGLGNAGWTVCEFRVGSHPVHALAAAIAPQLPPDSPWRSGRGGLAQQLISGELSLAGLLRRADRRVLLVVDQFEELYTLCVDPIQCERFVELLLDPGDTPTGAPPFSVLLALRADFVGQALAHRGLADALQEGVTLLGPMQHAELEEAVVRPAQAQGVRLQDGLAARILSGVGQAPGRLPLLEFALAQLWTRQEDGVLTHEAYEAIGQVEGALADYAEGVFGALTAEEQQVMRRVLTQMVHLGQDTDDSRRPLLTSELDAQDLALVQRLADRRLLVTDRDAQGQQIAEIAHEALIHGWQRLRSWIDADRAFQLWQQRARVTADQWLASGRDPGILLRGAPLAEADGWSAARSPDISLRVGEFVAASRQQRQREQAEIAARQELMLAQAKALADAEHRRAEAERGSNQKLRWFAAVLSVVTAVALLAGFWAVTQRNEARRQSLRAQSAQALADAQRQIAEREATIALTRQLGAQARGLAGSAPDLAVLLAAYALRLNDDANEETALLLDLDVNTLLDTVLTGQDSSVYSLTLSPDNRILAAGGENGAIWLWDLASRQLLAPALPGHAAAVHGLAFSPDGALLASSDAGGVIRLWDVVTLQPSGDPIQAHEDVIHALVFAADGASVEAVADEGVASAWNVTTGKAARPEIMLAGADANGMAISADGRLLAAKDGLTLTVQSALDGRLLASGLMGHSANIHDVEFSPDGRLLASAGFDGLVNIWDIAAGQPLYAPLRGHEGRVLTVAWSPDGALLASGGTDTRIVLWNVATGQRVGLPLQGHGAWVRSLRWSSDGQTLISGDTAGKILLWRLGDARWLAGHSATVRGLAFSPDGRLLASGSFDATTLVRDAASGQPLFPALHDGDSAVIDLAFSPDGRSLVTANASGKLLRWDAASGQRLGEPLSGHDAVVASVAFSPDGQTLASGAFDNTARLWDAASGRPLGEPLTGHSNWVISLAFSPDSRILATGSADNTIRLWDAASGAAIGQPLQGHTGWVSDLAWSADGATLISGSLDKTVRFWDMASGQQIGEPLVGHQAGVWSVMLNPADGGRSLYTGDNSGAVIWWDAVSHRALAPPLRTGIETESMALSPDGRTLAIGSFAGDGVVGLWKLPELRWTERMCAIANRELTGEEWARYFDRLTYAPICGQSALQTSEEAEWVERDELSRNQATSAHPSATSEVFLPVSQGETP